MTDEEIDLQIQKELDVIAGMLKDKIYTGDMAYQDFEDEVGNLVDKHCPITAAESKKIIMGIFVFWGNVRNYVREKANIKFE